MIFPSTMIIAQDSDTASTASTLVSPKKRPIPRYFLALLYISCVNSFSALCFIANDDAQFHRKIVIAVVLAYAFFLPYQGASILLHYLHRHDAHSIFRFSPSSPRAVAYGVFLVLLWTASMSVAIVRLRGQIDFFGRIARDTETCVANEQTRAFEYCYENNYTMDYWHSIAAVVATSLQLLLLIGMVYLCERDRRRGNSQNSTSALRNVSMTEK